MQPASVPNFCGSVEAAASRRQHSHGQSGEVPGCTNRKRQAWSHDIDDTADDDDDDDDDDDEHEDEDEGKMKEKMMMMMVMMMMMTAMMMTMMTMQKGENMMMIMMMMSTMLKGENQMMMVATTTMMIMMLMINKGRVPRGSESRSLNPQARKPLKSLRGSGSQQHNIITAWSVETT